jgi:hypothetical protein
MRVCEGVRHGETGWLATCAAVWARTHLFMYTRPHHPMENEVCVLLNWLQERVACTAPCPAWLCASLVLAAVRCIGGVGGGSVEVAPSRIGETPKEWCCKPIHSTKGGPYL